MTNDGETAAEKRVCGVETPLESANLFATSWCAGSDISIWSLNERRRISRFETVFDRFTSSFAVVPAERPLLVMANWERYGASAYDALTGELVWRRKDLKRAGGVTVMNDGLTVAIRMSSQPMTMLSGETGETVARLRDTCHVIPSAYASHALHIGTRRCMLRSFPDNQPLWRQPLNDARILTAAIGPDSILLSRSWVDWDDGTPYIERRHNPVRCIGLDGEVRWDWLPAPTCQLNDIEWSESSRRWIGLEWSWQDSGPLRIVQLSADGEFLGRSEATSIYRGAFMDRGRYLVSSEGAVLSLPDGAPVWQFASSAPPPAFAHLHRADR